MKNLYPLILSALLICTQTNVFSQKEKQVESGYKKTESHCDSLSVFVAETDTINLEVDSQWGVGDDGLFTANEPRFYEINDGNWEDVGDKIDDYDLTTSIDLLFNSEKPDTFCIIIKFPGLASIRGDTIGLMDEIDLFNGKRKSIASWEKSGKVKGIEILHNGLPLGCAELKNTYKAQSVDLKTPIPLVAGKPDTVSIIIKSLYPARGKKSKEYSISEIKLYGESKEY